MRLDPVNLRFNKKYIDEIKLCLNCPLHDCSSSYCPYLIPDETKARIKYREKELERKRKRYRKKKLEQKMNKGDKA